MKIVLIFIYSSRSFFFFFEKNNCQLLYQNVTRASFIFCYLMIKIFNYLRGKFYVFLLLHIGCLISLKISRDCIK